MRASDGGGWRPLARELVSSRNSWQPRPRSRKSAHRHVRAKHRAAPRWPFAKAGNGGGFSGSRGRVAPERVVALSSPSEGRTLTGTARVFALAPRPGIGARNRRHRPRIERDLGALLVEGEPTESRFPGGIEREPGPDRRPCCGPGGRGFESRRSPKSPANLCFERTSVRQRARLGPCPDRPDPARCWNPRTVRS
jgi:hypothetical protein